MSRRALAVLATGPLTLVQDLGRPGHRRLGVGPSGAADRGALQAANRLLGNPEDAAGLEVLLGGLVLRATADLLLVVTGAPASAEVDGRRVGHASTLRLGAGQTLTLGIAQTGARCYVGVRGGIAVAPVLGSRSTDMLSGLGPPPLQPGDLLPVGVAREGLPMPDQLPLPGPMARGGRSAVTTLPALPGPRLDRLDGGLALLASRTWTVGADSDRVGLRLSGPALDPTAAPLASEAVLPGAIQLPPDGQPVLFLVDAPVTGGYPVVAVVGRSALDVAAQLRPGDGVRFVVPGGAPDAPQRRPR